MLNNVFEHCNDRIRNFTTKAIFCHKSFTNIPWKHEILELSVSDGIRLQILQILLYFGELWLVWSFPKFGHSKELIARCAPLNLISQTQHMLS